MVTNPNAELINAGLVCPGCRYDLRGLSNQICPECGTAFELKVAKSRFNPHVIGWAAATTSLLIATLSVVLCVRSFHMYVNGIGSGCGTPRIGAWMTLITDAPLLQAIPILSWVTASKAKHGFVVARFGAIVALATWLAALGIIICL